MLSTMTQAGSLEVELEPDARTRFMRNPRPSELGAQLVALGNCLALARAVASGEDRAWESPESELLEFEPQLSLARFESPLVAVAAVPGLVLTSAAAMRFLIYAVKRIWTIDLEFRTHREQRERDFFEASAEAEKAAQRLSEIRRERSDISRRVHVRARHEGLSREQVEKLLRNEIRSLERLQRDAAIEAGWSFDSVKHLDDISGGGWSGRATWSAEDD